MVAGICHHTAKKLCHVVAIIIKVNLNTITLYIANYTVARVLDTLLSFFIICSKAGSTQSTAFYCLGCFLSLYNHIAHITTVCMFTDLISLDAYRT